MSEPNRPQLHIETAGHGPLVLLSHGGGDTASTWDGQYEPLAAAGFAAKRWDLRGHGRSASPDDASFYSRDLAVDDIDALVGEQPVVLVGHSLGGYLSLIFALRFPERVKALVLIATGPGYRDEAGRTRWNASIDKSISRGKLPIPAAAGRLIQQHDSIVIDGLGSITAPALIIVGERDEYFAPSAGVFAAKLGGPCDTFIVPDAGHHVHRSQADVVNARLFEFLRTAH